MAEVLNQASSKVFAQQDDFRLIVVEGHTDSDNIPKSLQKIYPSNWELSSARASKVVNYLIDIGVNLVNYRHRDMLIDGLQVCHGMMLEVVK